MIKENLRSVLTPRPWGRMFKSRTDKTDLVGMKKLSLSPFLTIVIRFMTLGSWPEKVTKDYTKTDSTPHFTHQTQYPHYIRQTYHAEQ